MNRVTPAELPLPPIKSAGALHLRELPLVRCVHGAVTVGALQCIDVLYDHPLEEHFHVKTSHLHNEPRRKTEALMQQEKKDLNFGWSRRSEGNNI